MKRIQRKRTKGYKMPGNCTYVGRPTRWGNPFRVGKEMTGWQKAFVAIHIRKESVERVRELYKSGELRKPITLEQSLKYYKMYLDFYLKTGYLNLNELRKYDFLSCWCPLTDKEGNPVACHADILIEILK